jgi:hypothetical protein
MTGEAPSRRTSVIMRASFGAALAFACTAFSPAARGDGALSIDATPEAVEEAPVLPSAPEATEKTIADVAFEPHWQGVSFGAYLAPKELAVTDDGGVDVLFHFHAGQMADAQWRASGANAVIVSAGFGIGTTPYVEAFRDPTRFKRMLGEVLKSLGAKAGRTLHARRVTLAAWSAGFAAVSKILAVSEYFDLVDTVVLNDALHTAYTRTNADAPLGPGLGVDRVNVKSLAPFVRFAREAIEGRKAMVMTHSSILPPDYASASEATMALLHELGLTPTETHETNARGMEAYYRADSGNLHVTGFKGTAKRDHMNHLYLVGALLREHAVPRWLGGR